MRSRNAVVRSGFFMEERFLSVETYVFADMIHRKIRNIYPIRKFFGGLNNAVQCGKRSVSKRLAAPERLPETPEERPPH